MFYKSPRLRIDVLSYIIRFVGSIVVVNNMKRFAFRTLSIKFLEKRNIIVYCVFFSTVSNYFSTEHI
jgi:hypothetical protein